MKYWWKIWRCAKCGCQVSDLWPFGVILWVSTQPIRRVDSQMVYMISYLMEYWWGKFWDAPVVREGIWPLPFWGQHTQNNLLTYFMFKHYPALLQTTDPSNHNTKPVYFKIWNRCMSQSLNQWPVDTDVHYVSDRAQNTFWLHYVNL